MKKEILRFLLAGILLIYANFSRAQGGTLNPNSTVNGTISTYTTDKWTVTTSSDGQILVNLTAGVSADFLVSLTDNDGATVLAGPAESFNASLATLNADGLAKGTYYILVTPYTATSGFGSYTLSNTFTQAQLPNDAEPNGSTANAVSLPLNGSKTGHVGYYYKGQRDTTDWYKVTTTTDGLLHVSLTTARGSDLSVNPLDVNVTLYDNDGTTQLGSVEVYNANGPATNSITADGLAPGTYYIKIQPYSTNEFADYSISNTLTPAQNGNDQEPNGSAASAISLPLNGAKTGHIGYYYKNQRDTADWYKVTTNADGLVTVNLSTVRGSTASSNPLDVNVTFYDHDGITQLGSVEVFNGYDAATNLVAVDGLAAGTYYIKIQCYSSSEFANYTISNTFSPAGLADDAEPNGSVGKAVTLSLNGSTTGHVGYYYNHQRDTTDWYKITTPASGLLQLNLSTVRGSAQSSNPLDVNVSFYDQDGTTFLGNVEVYNANGPASNFIKTDGLAAGTYYVKIQAYSTNEFANYTLSNVFTPVSSNDAEPNGSPATAVTLPLNSTKGGNVGYYYNLKRDTVDWYKVTTTSDGLLRVYLSTAFSSPTSTNILDVNVTLYDKDAKTFLGAVEVFNSNGPASNFISTDGLAPGTYYIKVQPYATNEFASYTIADSLFVPPLNNDAEPNGSKSSALAIAGNATITGHTGYYYNNKRDTTDWFKLTTTGAGPITLTLSTSRGSIYSNNPLDVNLLLFAPDGNTLLGNVEVYNANGPATNSIVTGNLPAGTYYIKLQPYSTNEFAVYTLSNISNAVSVLKLSSVITNAPCYGQTGSVHLTASGGTPPYTYYVVNMNSGKSDNNSTGIFTGLAAGNFTDSVVDANKKYITGSFAITQPAQVILPPILVPGSTTTVCSGATLALTDAVPGGVWSSSDPLLANVTPDGIVSFGTPTATAQVTIHYVVLNTGSCSASTSVSFSINPPLSAGSISGNTNICVGKTSLLKDPVAGGVWSSNSSNATINPTSGLVTGVTAGTATIVYTLHAGGCLASTYTIVTVSAVPEVAAISGKAVLLKGTTTILTDPTSGGTWSSSNASVATVDAAGKVKGIGNGTSTIYYVIANAGGCSDTARKQITVYEIPCVKLSYGSIVCAGGNTWLTATVTGGSGSYRYSLNGSKFQAENMFTVSAGFYFVLVQDNISKLYGFGFAFIDDPFPLAAYPVNQTNARNGLADGSFTVAGFGGQAPYRFSIDGTTYQDLGTFPDLVAGTYYVSIKDAAGCTKSNGVKIVIKNTNTHWKGGGDEITAGLTAHLFPNPAHDYFTLNLDTDTPDLVDIQVVDFLGHQMYHTTGSTADTFRFGQEFGKGTYFIRIVSSSGLKVFKAIKQ